jgi:hypothetical protein
MKPPITPIQTPIEEITPALHERLGKLLDLVDKYLPIENLSAEECTTLRLAHRSHRELSRLLTN